MRARAKVSCIQEMPLLTRELGIKARPIARDERHIAYKLDGDGGKFQILTLGQTKT